MHKRNWGLILHVLLTLWLASNVMFHMFLTQGNLTCIKHNTPRTTHTVACIKSHIPYGTRTRHLDLYQTHILPILWLVSKLIFHILLIPGNVTCIKPHIPYATHTWQSVLYQTQYSMYYSHCDLCQTQVSGGKKGENKPRLLHQHGNSAKMRNCGP